MDFTEESPKYIPWRDVSLLLLLTSNIAAIVSVLQNGGSAQMALWVYWSQSIIIGFFNVLKIVCASDAQIDTNPIRINKKTIESKPRAKLFLAGFFTVHFGLFHVAYFVCLLIAPFGGSTDTFVFSTILPATLLFFLNHLFSFFYNRRRERHTQIGSYMTMPYFRIVPMHLSVIIGLFLGSALLPFFMILKSIVDVLAHAFERHMNIRYEYTQGKLKI